MYQKVLDFLKKEVNLDHIPGAVVHVSYRGEVLLQEAIGNKVVSPKKEAMTLDTIFDLASLTKVVATTPAILKLIDDGEIRLDDPVSLFLPEFAQSGMENITIRNLLTHSSGLPAHRQFYANKLFNGESILEEICKESLEYVIDDKVVYSDLGFITLYKMIETIINQPFSDFINEILFHPLEMESTCFSPKYVKERFAATGYDNKIKAYKRGVVHDRNAESMGGTSGHAGLFSTIHDLYNFASMVENEGVYKGKRILSKAVLRLSKENYTFFDQEYRGLGWMIKSSRLASCGDLFSKQSYGHTGFTGTSMWFDPSINLHVILLTNRVHYGNSPHIIRLRPRLHNMIRSFF